MENNKQSTLSSALQGHFAVLLANVIFGLGVPVSKLLLDEWVTPMCYIVTRSIGAAVIFWAIQCFLPREKVERKDLWVIIVGGVLGFAVSQTLTAWALYYTSPVYFAILASLTPVAVLLLALVLMMERLTWAKLVGVLAAIGGALLLVLPGSEIKMGSNDSLGIVLAVLAVLTWAVYVVITRKVSVKYSAVTQMKWMFLVSAIVTLPIMMHEDAAQKLYSAAWAWSGVWEMAFIVVCATVLGYFMIPWALRRISATTMSVYTNLQPVVAMTVAIMLGQGEFSWVLVASCALVLAGGWLVTK